MRRVEMQPSMTRVGIPGKHPRRREVPAAPPLPGREPVRSPVAPPAVPQPPVKTPQPVPAGHV